MPRDPLAEIFDRLRVAVAGVAKDMLDDAIGQLHNQIPPPSAKRARAAKVPKAVKREKPAKRRASNPEWTHYDTLEISPRASVEVVHAAYKAQARRYHPDHNRGKEAAEKMRAVNLAHEVLSDATKRKAYDRSVGL